MATLTESPPLTELPSEGPSAWPAALSGLAATAVALGVSELLAGLVAPIPSLVLAIGNAVVDIGAGTPVKRIAVALFGTNEKTALIVGTVVLALIVGAGLGRLAQRRGLVPAAAGFTVFGLLGIAATSASPLDSTLWSMVSAVVVVAAAVGVLRYLLGLDRLRRQPELVDALLGAGFETLVAATAEARTCIHCR